MQLLRQETYNFGDKVNQFEGSIFLNADREIRRVRLDKIQYVKGYGDYMKVQCDDGAHTVHITMKNLESKLPSEHFYRVHKSYIIRMDKIDKVVNGFVQIGEDFIPISRNNKQELIAMLPYIK